MPHAPLRRKSVGWGTMIRRYLAAWTAVPLLFACTPHAGNNTVLSSSSQPAQSAAPSAQATQSMTVQQAAQAFGLIGTWASDCNQPPSTNDEHDVYALENDGTVSLVYDDGPDVQPNRYTWNQAVLIDQNTLQMDGIFYGDNLAQHTVLQKNDSGQMRVYGNVDGSGKILVQNGAFTAGPGGPAWVSKCSS
jgi:hypothetical protein